ncbi:hypothetical protein F0562_012893 [Nyssa sinensis]|uniref:C2H2-type domain-containing protein n=1 Tax=Nyssa sinensis TaxID=561372 RepID=A0A5J4ZV48_9ASTE|nr:hypothetical protein F0562_012893 [Nyssa sinensis]
MAMVVENVDQKQPRVVHYCKICKRGFGCGGALGGHMRAHVAGDVNVCIDQHPPMNNFHDKAKESNRPYFLQNITINRLMSGRASEDCGNKFLTLNSFIEHQRRTLDERVSPMSSPGSEVVDGTGGKEFIWFNKEKPIRSSTKMENYDENCASSEEEDLMVAMINKSFALANKEEDKKAKQVVKGMFQCKAFEEKMNSHDELSIPAVPATTPPALDLNYRLNDAQFGPNYYKKKSKVHECSICHRKFSSGQALGGHKRCHWLTSNLPDTSSMSHMFKKSKPLDLNLPALLYHAAEAQMNEDNAAAKFEVPTKIYLRPWNEDNVNQNHHLQSKFEVPSSLHDVNSKERKVVKLSNLRDMNLDGGSSTWLQVGIASTTDHGGAAS